MSSVFGLNASPHSAKRWPLSVSPKRAVSFSHQALLLRFVDLLHGVQDARAACPCWSRGALQRLHVLGKAGAAIAAPGVEEVVADARIGADAAAHLLDVGAELLGQVGELVHERDARREHGVGRVLGQLGRAHVHHQHALVVALERRIELRA